MKARLNKIVLLTFLLCLGMSLHGSAQTDSGTVKSGKKSWYLTMGIDQKMSSFSGKYKYYYEGEYDKNSGGIWGGGEPEWIWTKREWEENELLEWSQFYSTKIDMLISRSHKWNAGLSYNFGVLVYEDTQYLYQNISFIAITALGEYNYYFHKKPQMSPFAFGSLAAGFYRESEWNGGPGRELFGEIRAGLGYHNKKDWIFRAWVATNYLNYREHTMSPIFNKEQTRKVDINLFYWGLGIRRQFELVPE